MLLVDINRARCESVRACVRAPCLKCARGDDERSVSVKIQQQSKNQRARVLKKGTRDLVCLVAADAQAGAWGKYGAGTGDMRNETDR